MPAMGAPTVTRECAAMMTLAIPVEMAYFCMDDLYGYAIVDTGATKSMAGLQQVTWLQDMIFETLECDMISVDNTKKTRFTYANGQKGESRASRDTTSAGTEVRRRLPVVHAGGDTVSDTSWPRLPGRSRMLPLP